MLSDIFYPSALPVRSGKQWKRNWTKSSAFISSSRWKNTFARALRAKKRCGGRACNSAESIR